MGAASALGRVAPGSARRQRRRRKKGKIRAQQEVKRGAGPDESPFVYRKLESVLAAQPGIEIVHRLRPLAVVMAGADEFDPYRD